MILLLLIAGGVACGISGDYCFKTNSRLLLGFSLYAASGIPVWIAYRHGTWMEVAVYWGVLAILISGIMGVALFHEPLTLRQWIAFGLAVAAIVLWNMPAQLG